MNGLNLQATRRRGNGRAERRWKRPTDLVADQILVSYDEVSRRIEQQFQLPEGDHLGGLMNDLDIVLPLVRGDDPSAQSVGLSRLRTRRVSSISEILPRCLPQTDGIGPCADLLARRCRIS